ncbi:MAG TPA: deoxyribodipyrimidine photo-lyase [Solirubrobacteraceae bacterium]|nr:deoxyribodipyrimidine photo-lyase [Solirubrobacteraceae bacterium]
MSTVAILWMRRDLRLRDNPALAAAAQADRLVPVFCVDPRLLGGRHRSGSRTQFMLDCMHDVDRSLRELGSRLVIRRGAPERELPALAREVGATAVHTTVDVGPYARRRDATVSGALAAHGLELVEHPGLFVVDDPAEIRTGDGRPYTMFTPYHRSWERAPRREPLLTPRSLPGLPAVIRTGRIPALKALGLSQPLADPPAGGEQVGWARFEAFLADGVDSYHKQRATLGRNGTSALSPHLHFGCLSPRDVEHRLPSSPGAAELRRQLCWRDFYAQVLRSSPRNARSEHQQRYRARLGWSRARRNFDAWREGRTGYPVVDAAMRQLLREGWIHNRGRLIVGSFLTKDLGIDWRWGERWFMELLVDGDEASNNGNWQWIASVGVDPQPPARRLYNPSRQQQRFDPDGSYVRRYVPELERVPDEYLAEPWTMPADVQEAARCVIGSDYPPPIVDHARARREALDRFAAAAAAAAARS